MYYAHMQNADLIILDDPVSSFDSNKKYAILHRMFKNMGMQQISLLNKTVLLLTHDFEPITDFIVVGKISNENAISSFIWNQGGTVKERIIQPENDVCIITKEYADIAKNSEVNVVSRIAFLRKLCELNGREGAWGEAYEILSSLVHAAEIRRKLSNDTYIEMGEEEIASGTDKIKEYIADFDYEQIKASIYSVLTFDNYPLAKYLEPALSAVDIDTYRMGEVAATMLFDQIKNKGQIPKGKLVKTKVISRESTRKGENIRID